MTRMRERIRDTIENSRALAGAAWGAATKKSMQQSPTERYLELLATEPVAGNNPEEGIIKEGLTSRIIDVFSQKPHSKHELLTVPWSSRRIKPSRLSASLIAFSNDHGKKTVHEFFPIDEIFIYLNQIKTRAQEAGKPLTLLDQYDIALQQTNNNPVAAAILAHSAFRAVARSADTRIDPRLSFKVDSPEDAITMINIAKSTADFAINDKRDPLGNTYHWWSQFTANMVFTLLKRENPIQTRIYSKAFSLGPELTMGIRSKLLRMPLAAGDHKEVDRQGMRLGRAMGNLIFNKLL